MESNPKGVSRASSAVKDNGQPVIMTTDEGKATAKLPTWVPLVVAILSNLCFYAIDNTIVAVIQPIFPPKVNKYRASNFHHIFFLMAVTATVLVNGKLFASFNAKILYIAFSLLFVIGSIIYGAAPNMTALIFGRVIRGVGGTGMYLGALTLISVNTSPKETIEYMEYFALVWGFGSVIEPLVKGAFTDSSATLRWVGFVVDALTDTYILIYAAAALSLVLSVFFTKLW
ncbi:hypothetical protein ABEW05_011393 [Botrytis cinerea]